MRDRAMVFHDRERIVMRDLRVRLVECVDIGENRAERGGENRDLSWRFEKNPLPRSAPAIPCVTGSMKEVNAGKCTRFA